ncbi:MAG: glutathione synthase [Myxococcota bacterium]
MHLVFIMDPVSTVVVDEDTSFALMAQAERRGHRVSHALARDISLHHGRPRARIAQAKMSRESTQPVTLSSHEDIALDEVDAIFIRKDPPFDADYLWLTLMLEPLRGHTLVMNDPRGLRDANEKLYACHFPECMPKTLVSSDADAIKNFTQSVGGRAVIKPIDGHGGKGIFVLSEGDLNLNAHIESVTEGGSRVAMIQAYLPEVRVGDKRILLLDGEALGAILRVPAAGDARSNIHVGGSVVAAKLDAADHRIVEQLRPKLHQDGLYFVGLDVIGGYLTEVNVTSPTGIQQMSRLDGVSHEDRVIEWIERRVLERT